jgi:Holliday junction resolvase RusA-like endonuclease
VIRFTIFGRPQPQGSTKAFVFFDKNTGKHRAAVTSANPKLKSWRQEVSLVAKQAMQSLGAMPRQVPISVIAVFYFSKPQSAKKSAHKTTRPDSDKLLRATLDGLTGIVFEDDAQVIDVRVVKRFGSPERTEIAVGTFAGEGE